MNKRDRMILTARTKQPGTYTQFVAETFQLMIRAEAGAQPSGYAPAIVDGEVMQVPRIRGKIVCVTCGKVKRWKGQGMHAGHFLPGRHNSILFDESGGVNPQCNYCNTFQGGMPKQYRLWMEVMHGQEAIERLEALRRTVRRFDREELVDMLIAFRVRLKAAEAILADNE